MPLEICVLFYFMILLLGVITSMINFNMGLAIVLSGTVVVLAFILKRRDK